MTTGEKLRLLREQVCKSQPELAEELSSRYSRLLYRPITREMYANWETDRFAFGWDVAKALCRYYSISLDDLIFEERKIERLQKRRAAVRHNHTATPI